MTNVTLNLTLEQSMYIARVLSTNLVADNVLSVETLKHINDVNFDALKSQSKQLEGLNDD